MLALTTRCPQSIVHYSVLSVRYASFSRGTAGDHRIPKVLGSPARSILKRGRFAALFDLPPPMNDAAIRLDFRPHVELVASARRFVSDFYGSVLGDPDLSSRIALATHELLENVIKYSTDGRGSFQIEVADAEGGRVVRIVAANKTTAEHALALEHLLHELSSAPDPLRYYQELMRKSVTRQDTSAGLGLARIRAEGEMSVRFGAMTDGVAIIAEIQLSPMHTGGSP